MKKSNSVMYLFPDTEKIFGIVFHYSKKINGSFVQAVKKDFDTVLSKLKRYKNINIEEYLKNNTINVYIYPDIKSFRKALGYELQMEDRRKMNLLFQGKSDTRYMIKDEIGNIHMVLPQGRDTGVYSSLGTDLILMLITDSLELNEKKEYELKQTIKKYISTQREEEEKEANEKERQEKEKELQEELEEKENTDEIKEELLNLDDIEEAELEEIADIQEEINQKQNEKEALEETPAWLDYGWKAYICNRLANENIKKKFKVMLSKRKVTKPAKITSKTISDEFELDISEASVEYVIKTYGYEAFRMLLKDPDNIKGALYKFKVISKKEAINRFNEEVKAYISINYGSVKVKEVKEISTDRAREL